MKPTKNILIGSILVVITLFTTSRASADLVSDSRRALQQLVAQNPPDVVKAGFIFGAQGGQGILFVARPT